MNGDSVDLGIFIIVAYLIGAMIWYCYQHHKITMESQRRRETSYGFHAGLVTDKWFRNNLQDVVSVHEYIRNKSFYNVLPALMIMNERQ